MVQDEFAKVHVDLPNNPDTGGEAMWATPLGNDLYELRNSPFFAYGLNYGDVVRAVPRAPDQKPSVLEVVRRSGHRTVWVTFIDEASAQARSQRLAELHRWQAFHENANGKYFALDVEPEGSVNDVLGQLADWRDQGVLTYHTGLNGGFEPRTA